MTDESPTEQMEHAIGQIRREGQKVAVVYGVVDAAAVALCCTILGQLVAIPFVPDRVGLPAAVGTVLDPLGIELADPAVSGAAVLGLAAGGCVFAIEVAVRTRRPLIEQFEAANPTVREPLRTARDAVDDGLENRIAISLYEDVLDRLRETSSVDLLNLRRIGVTLVLVLALSVASIQVAALDLSLGGLGLGPGSDEAQPSSEYTGLEDGDEILGERTSVSAGEDDLEAKLGTSGDGSGNASDVPRAYDTSAVASSGDVEGQQAAFRESEQLADAELIREYNLQIRDQTNE